MTSVVIPDFDFSGFYYPQLLEALIQFKRRNVPELTDESAQEPYIQLLRAFALVGHLNNTLTDLVANESTLPTAKLVTTVRNMFRLIDFELRPATPAQADLVYELSKVFGASFELIPTAAQAATEKDGAKTAIFFEALTSLTIGATNIHSFVFAEEDGAFTDFTTEANDPTPGSNDFVPWVSPIAGDALYWGHSEVMWDTLSVLLVGAAGHITGIFEYYDGDATEVAPTSVTDLGGSLEIDLTSLLGTNKRTGTIVQIQLNETGAFEDAASTYTGSKNIITAGLLGQTSPATDPTKYTIGREWHILEDIADEPTNFTVNGKVEYPIPQNLTQDWNLAIVNGESAFWLRYRIVDVSTPTSPTIRQTRMDEGKQFAKRLGTQGKSRVESALGSSTGLAGQRHTASKDFFISGSGVVTVDSEVWTEVRNFLNSLPASKHYVIELGENDRATVVFGDGTNGRIPPIGVGNIGITYRFDADANGNVGANKITIDKTGLTFINKVFNPRQASGWREADGSTEASLERAKIEGPASLRIKDVAIGPDDVESLTKAFTDSNGASPFSRSRALEEGFGPKTIENVVVARGGALASVAQLAELDLHFNGDKFASPPIEKHLVANQETVSVNYTKKIIDITATVYGNVEEQEVINRLLRVIQPEALRTDGVTWEWEYGEDVPRNRINHEIFETDESITDVTLASPATSVSLAPRELPIAGAINVTVVKPS